MKKQYEESLIIKQAALTDIPGIMVVLEENLIAHKTAESDVLEKTGFLIGSFTPKTLQTYILDQNCIVLTAMKGASVVGYAMGYNINKLTRNYKSILAATSKTLKDVISSEKVFFYKHIAKKAGVKGVGITLSNVLLDTAKMQHYTSIITLIVHQPISNRVSIHFHEQLGYRLMRTFEDEGYLLGIYLKKL